jgi:hypothetical protein
MNESIEDIDDDSLGRQVLNMVWENKFITTFAGGWVVFNVIILVLLIYISIMITIRR